MTYDELKMILRHWPEPPYQCGSAPDIMKKALALITDLEWILNSAAASPAAIERARRERRQMYEGNSNG